MLHRLLIVCAGILLVLRRSKCVGATPSTWEMYKWIVHEYEMACYEYNTDRKFKLQLFGQEQPIVVGGDHLYLGSKGDTPAQFRLSHSKIYLTRSLATDQANGPIDVDTETPIYPSMVDTETLYLPTIERASNNTKRSTSKQTASQDTGVQYLDIGKCEAGAKGTISPTLIFNWRMDSTFLCSINQPQIRNRIDAQELEWIRARNTSDPRILIWVNQHYWRGLHPPTQCEPAKLCLSFE